MLITLSILGVVAALTIPSLVNRQSDLAAQVKLKKAIATYEQVAGVYMVENESTDIADMVANDCANLGDYFKIVSTGDDACNIVTADGAAWYFDTDTGYATIVDSATSPRYAVSVWAKNGQANGTGTSDGIHNAPATFNETLYTPNGGSEVTLVDGRSVAAANEFLGGDYKGENAFPEGDDD